MITEIQNALIWLSEQNIDQTELTAYAEEYESWSYEDGLSAVKLMHGLNQLQNIIDNHKKTLAPAVIEEIEKSGENSVDFNGWKFAKFTSGYRFTYDENEDWKELDKKKKAVEKEMKAIQKKMELAFKDGMTIVDEDSGEIYAPAKYKSGGKESFRVTALKK